MKILARCLFTIDELADCVCLELTHSLRYEWRPRVMLNDHEIRGNLDGVFYQVLRAIDPQLLRTGENVLEVEINIRDDNEEDAEFALDMQLKPLTAHHLEIQTGPALGAADVDSLSETDLFPPARPVTRSR